MKNKSLKKAQKQYEKQDQQEMAASTVCMPQHGKIGSV
jgi:hypothetical protein